MLVLLVHCHNNAGFNIAADQSRSLSLELALAKKLSNAMKSYHKQTNISNLNLAESKAKLVI